METLFHKEASNLAYRYHMALTKWFDDEGDIDEVIASRAVIASVLSIANRSLTDEKGVLSGVDDDLIQDFMLDLNKKVRFVNALYDFTDGVSIDAETRTSGLIKYLYELRDGELNPVIVIPVDDLEAKGYFEAESHMKELRADYDDLDRAMVMVGYRQTRNFDAEIYTYNFSLDYDPELRRKADELSVKLYDQITYYYENGDPNDPRVMAALQTWYKTVLAMDELSRKNEGSADTKVFIEDMKYRIFSILIENDILVDMYDSDSCQMTIFLGQEYVLSKVIPLDELYQV